MTKCLTCGTEMNLVPEGVSKKTGKPYNAFYSCPNRCPKIRYQNQAQNAPTGQISPNKAQPEVNWDRISFGKCKHAFLVEAFKLYNTNGFASPTDLEEIEENAEKFAKMSMRVLGEPKVNEYNEGEVNVDQVPF